ncbi:dienelactone hydrolase family protein [Janthinobacterium sp.]|uniref:alpha/beta hydrolase n=1 Tax=Janthinobacterium sp. TaxID=1871054 RepID=UPI002624B91B|nr:dienelactone hydrolase family protein [Janthinobacterium sp.]
MSNHPPQQQQQVIRLWPDGAPAGLPGVGPESSFGSPPIFGPASSMLRNVSEPTLTVFAPPAGTANGVGVIVCPGGAWRVLAWESEGIDLARWLAARGYTAFLLKYRLRATPPDPAEFALAMGKMAAGMPGVIPDASAPRTMAEAMPDAAIVRAREVAADDGRRAIGIVRERAAEWGVQAERIGMIGFSAGAFLTADIAVDPRAAPLAFVAALYGGETRGRAVPADAPPLFAAVAQDDRLLFRIVEGLYADWSGADRPAELHIFQRGGHGFGMAGRTGGLPVRRWSELLGDWLASEGFA